MKSVEKAHEKNSILKSAVMGVQVAVIDKLNACARSCHGWIHRGRRNPNDHHKNGFCHCTLSTQLRKPCLSLQMLAGSAPLSPSYPSPENLPRNSIIGGYVIQTCVAWGARIVNKPSWNRKLKKKPYFFRFHMFGPKCLNTYMLLSQSMRFRGLGRDGSYVHS